MKNRTGFVRHLPAFLCLSGAYLASWCLMILPLLLPMRALSFWPRLAVRLLLCLAAAVLAGGAERLHRAKVLARMRGLHIWDGLSLPGVLRQSVSRLLRVLPFLALFLLPAVLLYYWLLVDTYQAMRSLKQIGDALKKLFSVSASPPGYDVGCGALILAALLFLILTAAMWHRDVPMDYEMDTRLFRKTHRPAWRKMTLVNFLLSLPAFLIGLAVTVLKFLSLWKGGGRGLFDTALRALETGSALLQDRQLLVFLLLILLFVFLPCWCVRKWNITKTVTERTVP